jgi:hypothetical protein
MIIRHLRSNVVAYLALALAMTSTSYAATQLADGSVTTSKLAKSSVTSSKVAKDSLKASDLKEGSVAASEVKDGSLGSADVADGSLGAADVADGSLGAADVADGSLGAADVGDGSLGGADVADGSLGGADLADGSVTAPDLAAGVVPGDEEARATMFSAVDPVAVPDIVNVNAFAFTFSRAGAAVVRYGGEIGVNCSAGNANAGLYLDGNPILGAGVDVPDAPNARHVDIVKVGSLTAGPHTVSVGGDCPGGTQQGGNFQHGTWEVTLLAE